MLVTFDCIDLLLKERENVEQLHQASYRKPAALPLQLLLQIWPGPCSFRFKSHLSKSRRKTHEYVGQSEYWS
jgi:hypothetical protein